MSRLENASRVSERYGWKLSNATNSPVCTARAALPSRADGGRAWGREGIMSAEFDFAIARERAWRKYRGKLTDAGDYTAPAGPDYSSASEVIKAYVALSTALLCHERAGYGFPSQEGK